PAGGGAAQALAAPGPMDPPTEADEQQAYQDPALAKMEALVRNMQLPDTGVPVRSQKLFLTSIPSAFLGYDVVEWLTDNLDIEDQNPVAAEALHLANLLCAHGYFFPVSDNAKTFAIKDDSTLYRFQTPYYWPSRYQPNNTDYAIYLVRRSLKNKPKYALEEYEQEALQRLKKLLYHKWEYVLMQANEQATLAKDLKKTDKLIQLSQERAYWRIHRPPPGCTSCLEKSPVPNKRGPPRKKTKDDLKREIEILKRNLGRSRTKVSQILPRCEDYREFDSFLSNLPPGNPWITDDPTLWTVESTMVDTPSEKRLKRWALSLEELLSDPTGVHEFEIYLRKEYSHENMLFWKAVQDLRHGSHQDIARKVTAIYDNFKIRPKPRLPSLGQPKDPSMTSCTAPVFRVFSRLTIVAPKMVRKAAANAVLLKSVSASLYVFTSPQNRFFHFGSSTKKKTSVCGPLAAGLPTTLGGAGGGSITGVAPSSLGGVASLSSSAASSGTSPASRPPGRPLSGSTVDLRNSLDRRDQGAEGGGGSGVGSFFSGRHSHSTSDLHKLDTPDCSKGHSAR
ncbi:unnamed protein product, partial [Ixodes hexagonus]